MVAVLATKELKAGEFLLQFQTEAYQDNVHGSSSINILCIYMYVYIYIYIYEIHTYKPALNL